ncbi:MAG: hypothetical protein ACI392_03295 [Paludibacteraceae bacterium]
MKKFFSVWFVALLCGFTTAVSASVTVTLNCDPSDVSISGLTPDGDSWVKGENTCTTNYAYVTFTAAADKLGKLVVTDSYGYSTPYTPFPGYGVSVYDNYKLEISCWDMSEVRKGSFTLYVADASKIQLVRSDNTEVTLADGNNTVNFADGSHESGYAETSFTLKTSESDVLLTYNAPALAPTSGYSTYGSLNFSPKADATVTVSLEKLDELRTASFTVTVDEPANLSVSCGNRTITFTETTNTVKFVPPHSSGYSEAQCRFSGTDNWYTLKIGDKTSSVAKSYDWTAEDKATVDVVFAMPGVDVSVKFEGTIDAFSKVMVNGVEVDKATWSADNYTVKLGAQITLYGNNTDYTLNSLSLNGTELQDTYYFLNYGSSYSFTVTSESAYTVNLSATKLEPFDIYLTVNHPELFSVSESYGGSSPYAQVVVDEAEPNRLKVTLPAKTSYVYFNALDGCSFDSIKDGAGTHLLSYSSTSTSINNLEADAEFFVWIYKMDRTSTVYINFDDPTLFQHGGQVSRGAYPFATDVVIFKSQSDDPEGTYNNGYKNNEIPFDPQKENLISISLYGNSGLFYLNSTARSFGSSDRFENVQDEDVIDVYLKYYTFSFEDESESYTNSVLTTDLVKYGNLWVARPGTVIQFTTDAPSVKFGDAELVADEGVYSVTLDANATVVLSAPTPTAIEAVTIEKPRNNNVYTLQGILLIQNASEAQINALPCGLYIINGEKRIVTNRR